MADITRLNDIYLNFNSRITGNLYNCLWQLIVNNAQPDAAFYPLSDNSIVLALPEGGYVETGTAISAGDAETVCADLNNIIFCLSRDEADRIVTLSMRAPHNTGNPAAATLVSDAGLC